MLQQLLSVFGRELFSVVANIAITHFSRSCCGFNTPQAIFKWMRGDAVPTIDNLIILADMFDIPIDKIIIVIVFFI